MKSALLAAIFGITGGVAILLAVPAEEKAPVVKIHPAKWAEDAPVVPQIEEEAQVVPEPLEQYSVAQTISVPANATIGQRLAASQG